MTAYRETMGQVLQRMYDNKQLQIQERELSDTELKRREEIAKELPDEEFKDRYGSRWKEVKLATATKQAKSESVEEEKLEKMDEAAGFSAGMISKLKKSYSTLTKVDPTSPTAKKLFGVLDKMNKEQLIQIVKADINFLSLLAANRLIKDHNMKGAEINKLKKEEVDLDERARQLKDPKKEMMVSKGGDVKVIDKKDWPKYEKKGYVQAEETEIKEGTWAFPSNSRDIKKAKDFMRKPQPLGKEGDDASSALYSIFGDDELHDELYKAGKENPKRDARDIVKQWLKDMVGKDYRDPKDAKNVKDVAKQLGIKEEVELDEAKQPKITGTFVFNPDFDEKGGKSSTKTVQRYGLKVNSVDEDDGDKVVEVTGTMDQMVKMVAGEGVGEEDTPAENPEMEISGDMFSDAEKKKLNMRKYDVTQRKKSAGIKRMGNIQKEILSGSKNDLQKMVLDVIPLSKAKKQHRELFALYVNEEVELDEKAKYDIYHKDFSSAMQHAYKAAKKMYGITVDPKEIDDKVATGPRKPSTGKTNTYRLKGDKGAIQVQVYNTGKKYELNMYKEEVDLDEMKSGNYALAVKGKFVAVGSKADMMKMKKQKGGEIYMSPGAKVGDKAEEVELDERFKLVSARGKDIAKKMKKNRTMAPHAKEVAKMQTVTPDKLDRMLPDYVSGGDIRAMFKEELDEAKQVLAHGGKGKYKVVNDGSGSIDVMFKGKSVGRGDYDRGAGSFFMSIKGEKGQKSFKDAQAIADYFAKNKITEAHEMGTDEYRKYLEDLTPHSTESARSDAMRAMRRDKSMIRGKDSADVDDVATKDDRKAASKNILQQLKKTLDTKGKTDIEFLDKKKKKVPYDIAVKAVKKYMGFRSSTDKLKFQQALAKSYKSMLQAVKEDYVVPKTHSESILDRIDTKLRERKNG